VATPSSTYRLQIRSGFELDAAAQLCGYLAELGAGAAYCSPLLVAAPGSEHGYDVVDHSRIDPARGGRAGWDELLAAARQRGLGVVVDIAPNHAGVGDAAANTAWWDVLRLGRRSGFDSWFDIDWSRGRVLLPVLGDDFDPSELTLIDGELRYYEHRFPIAPGTGGGTPQQVHDRQHYELVNYRRADTEQNYRRFFGITTLAGLRVENDGVFDATHEEILRWTGADGIDGLRVDHPDGLLDPGRYLTRLHALAPEAWVTVEKILEPGETLPPSWPVAGTTGYDALSEVSELFVDPAGEHPLDALYRELTGDEHSYAEHVRAGKRLCVDTILQAEVARLARLAPLVPKATAALAELLVAFPVYRSYLPAGVEYLAEAIMSARARRPDLIESIAALTSRLCDPADELARRFQQTSGAVMAKGVEDTAYYRYTRFIALNEVGADPANFGASSVEDFHAAQATRQRLAPFGMTTLSTHDTKRGEDVRARLFTLAEIPDEWARLARRLIEAAPVPSRSFGYLLWQTFAGAGFIERERMHAYSEKAMREAADGTGWIDPNMSFEAAVHGAVDAAYDSPELREPLERFLARIEPFARSNSLAQKLVQLTMPGVPDVYQGTELWQDSLVDPDNRRPVDFGRRQVLLAALDGASVQPVDASGAAKLKVVARALHLRRDRPDLFTRYDPLRADGPAAAHAVAFDRGGAVTVATRLPVGLVGVGGWEGTLLPLSGGHTDVLTGRAYTGAIELPELLDAYPVALLERS
jgi:(1->4)-alpha-D-glucan 1-alpha-D-glucosylmutase